MKKRDKIIIFFAFAWLITLIVSFKMNMNFFENYDYHILSFIRNNTHFTSFYKFITFLEIQLPTSTSLFQWEYG